MRICVVGSGLTGLTAAYRLSLQGNDVTVLEKEPFIGGMMSSFSMGKDSIPKTYHHIMKFDDSTRCLIKELGLFNKYYDTKTKMGFYYNGKINNLSNPTNILGFEPLSIESRIKFITFGLKILKERDWDKLEYITAEKWIKREANEEIYEKMFKPLLRIKFSNDYNKIIARWVGERLKLRESSGPFGYLRGGLEQIIEHIKNSIKSNNGKILTSSKVLKLKTEKGKITTVVYTKGKKRYEIETDAVLYTGPTFELTKMTKLPKEYARKLRNIRYKSTLCAVLGFNKKITDYYWINFIEEKYSFGGVIQHSSLNLHLKSAKSVFYLFTYLDKTDKFWKKSDNEILKTYISDLEKAFPNIRNSLNWKRLFRIECSKPVYEMSYKKNKIDYQSPIENLFMGGIAVFYPKIRNMGTAIEAGEELAALINDYSSGL